MKKVTQANGHIMYVTNQWTTYCYDEATAPPTPTEHNYAFADTEDEALEYSKSIIITIYPQIRMEYAVLVAEDVEDPHRDKSFDNGNIFSEIAQGQQNG